MGKVGDALQRRGLRDDEILRLFRDAQEELIGIVERANPLSPWRDFRGRQVGAINAVILRLQNGAFEWADREIAGLVNAGADETRADIAAFKEHEFDLDFAGVDQNAIRVLVEDAFMEFGNTILALKRNAERAVLNKRKLAEGIAKGVIQGSSVARTQKELVGILQRDGIEVLRAKNGFGRRFSLLDYTNLLVRTQSMTAYNLGGRAQMLGSGRRFALFPTIRPDIDGEDVCNEWERKKYIDLKKDPLPPQSTHPRCRHRVRAASFEQLRRERPDLYRIALAEFRRAAG